MEWLKNLEPMTLAVIVLGAILVINNFLPEGTLGKILGLFKDKKAGQGVQPANPVDLTNLLDLFKQGRLQADDLHKILEMLGRVDRPDPLPEPDQHRDFEMAALAKVISLVEFFEARDCMDCVEQAKQLASCVLDCGRTKKDGGATS